MASWLKRVRARPESRIGEVDTIDEDGGLGLALPPAAMTGQASR